MPQCFATTKNRNPCTAFGSQQGLCRIHTKMPIWQAERARRLTQNVVHDTAPAPATTETEVPVPPDHPGTLVPARPTLDLALV